MDTFEAVKNNVYGVLGDLAKDLPGPELDLLFSKFEACAGWPAPDALKAMDLLKQLAKSDAKVSLVAHLQTYVQGSHVLPSRVIPLVHMGQSDAAGAHTLEPH